MQKLKWRESLAGKILILTLVIAAASAFFYWIVADDWNYTAETTSPVGFGGLLPLQDEGETRIEQTFRTNAEELNLLVLYPDRVAPGTRKELTVRLRQGGDVLWERVFRTDELNLGRENPVSLDPVVPLRRGEPVTLEIDSSGTGISFHYGNTVSAGKFELEAAKDGTLTINGTPAEGTLRFSTNGIRSLNLAWLVWLLAGLLWLAAVAFLLMAEKARKAGKMNLAGQVTDLYTRFNYLLKKLVLRDFRIKYQSSILGMFWSFLNPLLSMFVYLFVFNTLFHSDVENFPVYLLSGIVLFNYFNESTTQGLGSIVNNRGLITKVYMPKYIYPLSKVLSSAINLTISFIPLVAVILVTGMPLHKSILLLPLVVLFLVMFCTGMSMILATLNVFFRDTEFLWGILVMVLNFLTPVFYPETIIPVAYRTIYHMNPMYQIIYLMRTITIGGVAPTPITFLYCFVGSVVPLALGFLVMKKKQDQFVLHL